MPLMKFHIYKGWSDDQIETFLNVAHSAMIRSFGVPDADRYQLITEHRHGTMIAEDTGLGFDRSDRFVLAEVVSRPRSQAEKMAFYENMCSDLHDHCGIPRTDIMISFIQNTDDDWSFGLGRAQFVTGEL